jgi:hypothetical protein
MAAVFKNKFEKHAMMIVCMPFLGLFLEWLSRQLGDWGGTVYDIFSGICTALWFGSMIWGVINCYFLCIQKTSWPRKLLWCILSLTAIVYTLALLLWIEFDMG